MSRLNLLPSTVLESRARKARKAAWSKCLVGYCILVLVGAVAADGVFVQSSDALESEALSLQTEIAAAEAGLALLEQNEIELAADAKVLAEIHGQPDWSILLRHLSSQLDDRLAIRSVRVSVSGQVGGTITPQQLAHGPYQLELSGIAREQSAVTAYVLRLERAGLLEMVTLKGTSPTRLADSDGVQFSVSAAIGTEVGP